MTNSYQRGLNRRTFLRYGGVATVTFALPGLVTACGGGDSASSASGLLRVAQADAVSTLDPQKQGSMIDMSVLSNVFDFLTRRDDNGKLVGGLAEKWTAVNDTTWRFTLRKGVKFHNGEPFDAAAAKFSLERLLDPATKSPIVELKFVTGVKLVDDATIEVKTKTPDPLIPAKVSLFGGVMVPPKYIEEKGDDHFAQNPVGTGAFKFVSFERDSEVALESNNDYYLGAPKIKELQFRPIPNPSTAMSSLQAGEIEMVTGVTSDATQQVKGDDSIEIVTYPGLRSFYLSLDTLSGGPLAKKEVRQALNYAVNVPQLIDTVLGGAAQQIATIIPPQNFGFDPSVQPYEHDPDKAAGLLAKAGYPDGFSTQLTGQNSDGPIVEAIAGQLRDAGIDIEVKLLDPGTYETGLLSDNSKELGPMFYVGNTAWTMDASNNVQSYVKSDRRQSRWNNKRADQLVTIEETNVDPAARKKAFAELQSLMKEEAPFVYLYAVDNLYAMKSDVSWPGNDIGLLRMDSAAIG
ncbi:MAG: ABC transporter substrate-binding protein [Actinomycetia bacterium]|nr:ABC transporter substrate-binding protein [Actinomycetes bacterium]